MALFKIGKFPTVKLLYENILNDLVFNYPVINYSDFFIKAG